MPPPLADLLHLQLSRRPSLLPFQMTAQQLILWLIVAPRRTSAWKMSAPTGTTCRSLARLAI